MTRLRKETASTTVIVALLAWIGLCFIRQIFGEWIKSSYTIYTKKIVFASPVKDRFTGDYGVRPASPGQTGPIGPIA